MNTPATPPSSSPRTADTGVPADTRSPAPPVPRVDRGDRRRGLQLSLGIALFVVAQVVMGIVATLLSGAAMGEPADPWARLIGALAGAALALGGYLVIVGRIGGRPGLALRGRGKLAELVTGLGIGVALVCLSASLIALLGGYTVTGLSPSPQLLVPLALGIGAGVVEEIAFRGILVRLLDAWLGSWAALAITSLLFGLMHLPNPDATLLSALGLVIEAGVLLGAAYLLTRRLWLAIGIHIAWNTVLAGVFSSAVSGTGRQSGLLLAEVQGPTWLTGGAMGLEGSLVSVLLGLAAGIVMLVLAARRGRLLPSVRAERVEPTERSGGEISSAA